jgi:hypothetical protein
VLDQKQNQKLILLTPIRKNLYMIFNILLTLSLIMQFHPSTLNASSQSQWQRNYKPTNKSVNNSKSAQWPRTSYKTKTVLIKPLDQKDAENDNDASSIQKEVQFETYDQLLDNLDTLAIRYIKTQTRKSPISITIAPSPTISENQDFSDVNSGVKNQYNRPIKNKVILQMLWDIGSMNPKMAHLYSEQDDTILQKKDLTQKYIDQRRIVNKFANNSN